jgi:mevalonate kinase
MNSQAELTIQARGKLLLCGEYAVLDGALALAVPVRYGQTLTVRAHEKLGTLLWESKNDEGAQWFRAAFSVPGLDILQTPYMSTAERLQGMLRACRKQNPEFLNIPDGWLVQTQTDFPRQWGLGTSSTLIAALARWAGVDPYLVLAETLGGSGYDIACAFAEGPLLYRWLGQKPTVQAVDFAPPFAQQLFFVFLEKKQNSREGISRYRALAQGHSSLVEQISACTRRCLEAQTLADFSAVMLEHENLISRALELPRAQDLYFSDFPGVVKSLGAWGGDFVLAMSEKDPSETVAYFSEKGFSTCIPYLEMVLGG